MIYCSCGELAEVRWQVNGVRYPPKDELQVHELCSNCMSRIWKEIKLKYNGSLGKEASTFTVINQ